MPFDRLIDSVLLYALKQPGKKFNIQAGVNVRSDIPSNVTFFDFASQAFINDLISSSDLVITHSGTGSIIAGLEQSKCVVTIPRLAKYGEHNDDHQMEIAEVFSAAGHVLFWHEGDTLDVMIERSETFKPVVYRSDYEMLVSAISEDINGFML